MHKDTFKDLLIKKRFSAEDIIQLDQLIEDYPWFILPRYLKLKAANQLNSSIEDSELNKAAVFCSDRKFLYQWLYNQVEEDSESYFRGKSELEFIDNGESEENDKDEENASFELLEEFDEIDDADVKAIPEKEETDMEIDDFEEDVSTPVMDSLDEADESEIQDLDESDGETEEFTGQLEESKEAEKKNDALGDVDSKTNNFKTNQSLELIENFLQQDPGIIKADKETSLEGDISKESVIEDDGFITDTLAKIYLKQGLNAKAIYAYERLSLKYPEKSAYFAAQIEKIKNISNV